MVQQSYAIKSISHCTCSGAKDHCTSSPGLWIEKQYYVLGMHAYSFPRSHDFTVH